MSDVSTIRERILRATSEFRHQEAVVLTTFNLSATFFEEQALPAVLGVEAKSIAARRAELHQRLGLTSCSVFYDPTFAPRISGKYRYAAYPVPLRGRFFHPKLVIIAGRSKDDTSCVYLSVSSANLSLSGWGRNAESFGEIWIRTKRQQSCEALVQFLEWLRSYTPLGQHSSDDEAVVRALTVLNRMPEDEISPASADPDLYTSVVDKDGLAGFLHQRRSAHPSELRVFSPYWSEIPDQLNSFQAKRTSLFPALRIDGSALAITQSQAKEIGDLAEIRRNKMDIGNRFWHMKMYQLRYGSETFTAVGSCNFTQAGLAGGGGNVEAMLVFDADPNWIPDGTLARTEELAQEPASEEESPDPPPVVIVVAFDWRDLCWRWWLEAGPQQRSFSLQLPSLAPIATKPGTHRFTGDPPPQGATFMVTYETASGLHRWEGQVVEINLSHSKRVYGRPLSANEILESWRGRAPSWDLGSGGVTGAEGDEDTDDVERDTPAAFDAVNLFDLYRSMRGMREKLTSLTSYPDLQRSFIIGRPDSIMALAYLADREGEAPVVRYLVLREMYSVVSEWAYLLDKELVSRAELMTKKARHRVSKLLGEEFVANNLKADEILDWFENRLAGFDGRAR